MNSTSTLPGNRHAASTTNGIDTTALRGAIDAMSADADLASTHWRIRSRWLGGTRTDHFVDDFTIGGERVQRPFVIRVDEPKELCGTNQYPNPQEHLLAALNACMMVGYSAVAALMGVTLTRLEVETRGEIDLRGFLGIDSDVRAGYASLQQTVRIAGDGTPEQFQRLHDIVRATSPNFFNVTRAVAVDSRLEIE